MFHGLPDRGSWAAGKAKALPTRCTSGVSDTPKPHVSGSARKDVRKAPAMQGGGRGNILHTERRPACKNSVLFAQNMIHTRKWIRTLAPPKPPIPNSPSRRTANGPPCHGRRAPMAGRRKSSAPLSKRSPIRARSIRPPGWSG